MTTRYYYDKDGVTTGPFTLDQLLEMEQAGIVRPDTRILVENDKGAWTTWAQIPRDSPIADLYRSFGENTGAPLRPGMDVTPWCWTMTWALLALGGIVALSTLIAQAGPYFGAYEILFILCILAIFGTIATGLYALGSIVRWLYLLVKLQEKQILGDPPESDSCLSVGENAGAPLLPGTDAAPMCWIMAWMLLPLGSIVALWALLQISWDHSWWTQILGVLCIVAIFAAAAAGLYALGSIESWLHLLFKRQQSRRRKDEDL